MPNRRVAILQLLLICAGVSFLPSCLHDEKKTSIPFHSIGITPDNEQMLADLAETILPKTDTPGAKDLSAHLFALKMVDDCFTKSNQKKFIAGMKDFEAWVQKKTGKSFSSLTVAERQALITPLDGGAYDADGMDFFYNSVKHLTIQAYTTGEYFMTKIRGYKMIPGTFQGCIPLKTA